MRLRPGPERLHSLPMAMAMDRPPLISPIVAALFWLDAIIWAVRRRADLHQHIMEQARHRSGRWAARKVRRSRLRTSRPTRQAARSRMARLQMARLRMAL